MFLKGLSKTRKWLALSAVLLTILLAGGEAMADGKNYALNGLTTTANTGYGADANKLYADPSEIIGKVIGVVLSFIGILFFVLVIYGGFLWMTARGKEEQVNKAIDLITQASIGLAVVAAAYLITKFLGETILGLFTS